MCIPLQQCRYDTGSHRILLKMLRICCRRGEVVAAQNGQRAYPRPADAGHRRQKGLGAAIPTCPWRRELAIMSILVGVLTNNLALMIVTMGILTNFAPIWEISSTSNSLRRSRLYRPNSRR